MHGVVRFNSCFALKFEDCYFLKRVMSKNHRLLGEHLGMYNLIFSYHQEYVILFSERGNTFVFTKWRI